MSGRVLVAAILLVSCVTSSRAISFVGTIDFVFVSGSTDLGVLSGDSFSWRYRYESDAVDGIFVHQHLNNLFIERDFSRFSNIAAMDLHPTGGIRVEGGEVVSAFLLYQFTDVFGFGGIFTIGDVPIVKQTTTAMFGRAIAKFSTPTAVPEAASTLVLLGLAVIGLRCSKIGC
jgi:hypothetical protein